MVTWLKIFKPSDSTKKLSQMVLSQVTGNLQKYEQHLLQRYWENQSDHKNCELLSASLLSKTNIRRSTEVFIFQLFTGHCQLKGFLYVTSGSRRCRNFRKFRSKIRNVRHQTSTFKMADPAGTKTVEEAKKGKTHPEKTQPTTQERECPRCHHPEGVRIRNSAI